MASRVRAKSKTRNFVTRSRWSTKSLSRRRQENTMMLPLSGIHPDQISDLIWADLSDPSPRVGLTRMQTAQPLPSIPAPAYVPSTSQSLFVAPDRSTTRKSDCAARTERREVLFATNKSGGDHKKTPKSDRWGEPC